MNPEPPTISPVLRAGNYTIREATPADREGILASFNRVFSEGNPRFVDRTETEWDWGYLRNPAGRQIWIAVDDRSGTVAAHFAGWPMRVFSQGETVLFSHIVDSYTHPDHRRGLKRPGLFTRTANAFIDHLVWPHENVILYGLPVPDHFRLGARQIGYEVVRTQLQLVLRAEHDLHGGAPANLTVEEIEHADDSVERLFHDCADLDGARCIKDAAFINWRYVDHPGNDYRIGVVRDGDDLRGLAVFTDCYFSDVQQGVIADWLVPKDDEEAGRALMQWARDRTRQIDREQCSIVLSGTDPWWAHLQSFGLKALPTKYILVYGNLCRDPRYDEDWLRAHWSYALGETDLA